MVERKQPQKLPTYAQPTKCSDLKITGKQLTQQQPPKFISKPVIQKRVTIPQFQPKIISKVSIKPKRECLVYWVRHGARADQDYSSPLAGTYVYENDIDTYLTEQGHKDAVLAGERIIADVKLQGWNPEEVLKDVKVISSPLLRTLQTSAGIKSTVTNSLDQSIIVNEYMINELRDWDADYLTKSCYATMPHPHILNKYLHNKVKSLVKDTLLGDLPPLTYPDPDLGYDSRFISGWETILQQHFVNSQQHQQKQVLIVVGHHSVIEALLNWAAHVKTIPTDLDPSYCSTIQFKFECTEGKAVLKDVNYIYV
ncbi:hypothetical protein FGO68_gene382 [Halteria grandinella]|uniref:Phosphoglycerate mutase n=1 Tax=Halteria grandinella TaxID=5974 RepID=A0A8J8NLI8_HALGN|nr:hypothetical protein FGO68_gene382 [Halteria grandinella]